MCWDNLFSFYVASSKVAVVSNEGNIEVSGYILYTDILFPITGVVHMPKKRGVVHIWHCITHYNNAAGVNPSIFYFILFGMHF